jgi:PAS domain S-box-containing protein
MKVNTALSFLCLGAGLWLAGNDERQRNRRILGLLVVMIAGSTLAEYAFHISLGIDQLLLRDTRAPSLPAYPGRMAIATAICLLLLGLAVMFLGLKKALVVQRALVVACFAISLVALCGYLYGVESLYSITPFSTMAVHTSAGLLVACLAYFLARPNEGIVSIAVSDSNSGLLLRTLVPAIIVVPILIGWLRLAGQRANLYGTPFGAALLLLGSIGCLAVLTMLVARSMYRWECESSHAEKTMRESEERFRLVADTAPVLIWMSGPDKLCTYFNKPWLDFTGRSIDSELGNGWAEGVHPEDLQRCLETYTKSFDRREKFRMEYRLRGYDGEYRWILDIGVPRFNEDGSFAGYIGSGVDVTERKRAEEALRDSEERFRLAARAGKMFAYEWDAATDVMVRSGECAEILGIDKVAQVTTGQQILAKVYPDDREKLLAADAALNTEKPRLQVSHRMVRPDGSVIWVERTGRAHFDEQGKMLRIVGMVADITERKRAEEALRESEARLRLAAQAGKMYAYEWDVATDATVRSEEYANILGLTGVQRCDTRQQFLSRVHPDDRAKFIAAVADLTPENPTTQISYRVLRPDGVVIWLEKSGRAFFDAQGRMLRMIGIVADITERKLAEQTLHESEKNLAGAQARAHLGSWVETLTDHKLIWSDELYRLWGLEPRSVESNRDVFLRGVHPDDRAYVREKLDTSLAPDTICWRTVGIF